MKEKRRLEVLGQPEAGVGRREVLQGLFAGVGAGMALPGVVEGHPVQQHAKTAPPATAAAKLQAASWKPEFLDDHQFATLTVLCARIVPGSDTALADRYIDSRLAVETRDGQRRFLSAMGALDGVAMERFAKPLKSITEAQQVQLLTEAAAGASGGQDWVWTPGTPLVRPDFGPEVVTLRDHVDHLKGWISGAYYSSEAGLKELGYTGQMFFASFPDCTHKDHA
jgi:hypothetical protein